MIALYNLIESLCCLGEWVLWKPSRDKHSWDKIGIHYLPRLFFPSSFFFNSLFHPLCVGLCLFQYMWSMCQTSLIRLRINPCEMLISLHCTVQLSWDQDNTAVGLNSWTEHVIVQPCCPCHCKTHLRLNASCFEPFETKNILGIKMSLHPVRGGNQILLRTN